MKTNGTFGRLGLLVIGGVVASAAVAAIALAGSNGSQSAKKAAPPAAPAGQVQLGSGPGGSFPMLAYSWGASNSGSSGSGGGAGAGKANVQDISITKVMDATSVELLKKVTNGSHYATATITASSTGGNPKMVYQLEDILVTSVAQGGSGGDAQLTENVTLNFAKVTWTYTDAAGVATSGSWNVVTGTP